MSTFKTICLASIISALCSNIALAQQEKTVRFKMQSGYALALPILGEVSANIPKNIAALSNQTIKIQYFEPKGLVPNEGIYDGISTGAIDIGYAGLGFFVQKNPALAYFDAVPFGMDASGLIAWFNKGEGGKLRDEVLAKDNIKGIACGFNAAEAGGWFNREINSSADLKGLKMRIAGLGGRVYEKLGVSTQSMAGGDIYPALERGVIDAAEYSMPALDQNMGLYEIAKYYYFPGWHQPASIQTLMINKTKWDELSPLQQAAFYASCDQAIISSIAIGESIQGEALAFIKSKNVNFRVFPTETLADLNGAWHSVSAEFSKSNADFKRIADSYNAFQKSYSTWRKLSGGQLSD